MTTDHPPKKRRLPIVPALMETFGLTLGVASAIALVLAVIGLIAVVWVIKSAPPRTLTITSGPAGSSFQRYAEAYQKALATHGVTLLIQPSEGSLDNLRRLQAPDSKVDIGFLQSGVTENVDLKGLVSLGSIAYQPLWVFYRGSTPINRLSELAGKRIAVGPVGSGTHALASTLLQLNGITASPPTTLLTLEAEPSSTGLLDGKIDAVFLMGDSAPAQTLRTLLRNPDIHLYSYTQADAYVRRYSYLNKMELPEGSIDFGKNLPTKDVDLIGPTVELVAQEELNSTLSDLLLEVAKEVHGKPSLLQKRGEFPSPLEHEIPISEDARRYYKSGMGILYHTFHSFWLASILNRLLVAVVPLALVLIPTIRFLPVAYRLRIQLRIYRCYRPLLALEHDSSAPLTRERSQELLLRLDEIEQSVKQLRVPASFADQFYALKGHIGFVRQRLKSAAAA